ncbi:DUF4159 domain-containing protein [Aerophototrophica crusticola]|uniref:DUF4159 domain-containing protein n=1 Tax=Aerophototrophica crusticola TaxID=1709002 RepID=A0A858RA09_9PROT|nr:DUF4159 domain-containing protein [Rhodospirillaceae bacterium B3]
MLSLGPLAFAAPWLLAALAVLPVLWWLLKVTPPAPRIQNFPAIRLLRDLVAREETPARTPPWLLILRIILAALVILALSRPLLNPDAALPGSGPMLLLVDNGWASGRDWAARTELMDRLVDQADRQNRPVVVLATAPSAAAEAPRLQGPMVAGEAKRAVQALAPQPWPSDRAGAMRALEGFAPEGTPYTVWLSDGLADAASEELVTRLRRMGGLEVVGDGAERPALLLRPPAVDGIELVVPVERSDSGLEMPVSVRANGNDGRLLGSAEARFEPGSARAEVRLNLPTELRNEVTALRLDGQSTAGATILLDERWRRRPVGLVSGRPEGEQPLLSDLYYLERALSPFAEVRRGTVADLMGRQLSVLILADVGSLGEDEARRLEEWVKKGGVLVRFAGPRLSQNADTLVPVRLRAGDRALGGALSWSTPARLAPFPETSPFHGLPIPGDVTVTRQVLAEPSVDLASRTWARLEDGTPLVTAEKREAGQVVLVHTTANPDWSNLPLSGLFVEMLRRTVALSAGVAGVEETGTLPPLELLDGQGRLTQPPATAFPVSAAQLARAPVAEILGPRHPPGFYGTAEARRALNLAPAVPELRPLAPSLSGVAQDLYGGRGETELKPLLLTLALILGLIDLLVGLALRGLLRLPRMGSRGVAAAVALLALGTMLAVGDPAVAQNRPDPTGVTGDERIILSTNETWLAYVVTGDPQVDAAAKAGLEGLAQQLAMRTAVEIAGAMPVDVEADELSFFPLVYWPVTQTQGPLTDQGRQKLNDYLRHGGMLLVDTRDQGFGGSGPGGPQLEQLLRGLDIPPLAPVPPEHVLTKSFYLLQDFPGRYSGGNVWVEAQEGRTNDGVSGVVLGANDWAAAWAVDGQGRPMFAVASERQREMAYRFGINLVMYALTGNYKADQVHVPAILERLGQ